MKHRPPPAPLPFVFFTYKADSCLSRCIVRLTRYRFSHMGIGFRAGGSPHPESAFYYEALFKEGFTGPKPFTDLVSFSAANPGNRVLIIYLTGIERNTVMRLLTRTRAMVGTRGYAKVQLLLMALSERYGLPVPRSKHRVVCSEIIAELLFPIIDLRDDRRRSLDAVTPGSAYVRLLERHANIQDKPGAIISVSI